MPNTIPPTTTGITSSVDNQVAVYDGNRSWRTWNKRDVYFHGGPGANRYVPKIGDHVVDDAGPFVLLYKVTDLDLTTLNPTLVKIKWECSCGDDADDPFAGNDVDTYRVYLDTSVTPHELAVDARFQVGGTMVDHVKVFLGIDISIQNGKPVSFLYDNSGQFLTNNVPLELVALDSHTNHSIKRVKACNTNRTMRDGELVTVVAYSDTGHVVGRKPMWIVNTSFMRAVDSSQKYISRIGLKTPYLSDNDDHVLELPMNTHVDAFNFVGQVYYSDGSKQDVPIDNTKFRIMGLDNFISTVPGQRFPMSISYALSNGEITYNATAGEGKFVTEPYEILTTKQNNAYVVKLFGFPVWVDSATGYAMRWYIYNLDRNASFEVTPYVHTNTNAEAFNGKAYGKQQKVSVRINLRDISLAFKSYLHVQTLDIVLREPGTERTTNWTIGFEPNQLPLYGVNNRANARMITSSNWKLRIGSGATSLSEWLERLYTTAKPLIDRQKEVNPPVPNYFAIVINETRYEYPIASWNAELNIGRALAINGTLFIEFIQRKSTGDVILSMAGLPIYEI